MSHDHKPGDELEYRRIIKAGGRVEPIINSHGEKLGPDRVWLLNEDSPGLAMSRSLGDN